jgi:hypothetical protein
MTKMEYANRNRPHCDKEQHNADDIAQHSTAVLAVCCSVTHADGAGS